MELQILRLMRAQHLLLSLILAGVCFWGCTKDVEIPFPDVDAEYAVDGQIVAGQPPFLFLTRTQSFNAPLDQNSLQDIFENDAVVTINDGDTTITLQELCSDDIPEELRPLVAAQLGVDPEALAALNFCAYVQLPPLAPGNMVGEIGKTYTLDIVTADDTRLSAVTDVAEPVALDSIWFETFAAEDSLGFIHALLDDPAGVVNAYRWSAQRLTRIPGTDDPKDPGFIYPTGSAFEDRFFDGLRFEIFYNRGAGTFAPDEEEGVEGFFNIADTVAIRFASISLETYDYVNLSDQQASNNGSPFAVPANLLGNVEGGRGLWAGYSFVVDTLFPQ